MRVSDDELRTLQLKPETIELAMNLMAVNGYVIFEGVLPSTKVQEISDAYRAILEPYLEEHADEIYNQPTGFNAYTNHIRLYLPFEAPFNDSLVIAHPFALAILDRVLGEDCRLGYFATNTTLPGGKRSQPVHSDQGAHFGNHCAQYLPTTNVVLNIPLVDVNLNNGPMEIWPGGTHRLPDSFYGTNGPKADELAKHMTSLKVQMPAGSILLRDMRMWHRGTPNHSDEPRPNLALVYGLGQAALGSGEICIPQETYDALSEREQRLLRFEKIGQQVIRPYH